jgi:hypothetical protein
LPVTFNQPGLSDLEFLAAVRNAVDVPLRFRIEASTAMLPYNHASSLRPTVFSLGNQDVTISVKIPGFLDGLEDIDTRAVVNLTEATHDRHRFKSLRHRPHLRRQHRS